MLGYREDPRFETASRISGPPIRAWITMPITTWKIMVRRAGQQGYHYVATHQKGRAPVVGEQIASTADRPATSWTVAEIFKDHSTKAGIDVFTVRVDETEGGSPHV
jgi:hypothetical protein